MASRSRAPGPLPRPSSRPIPSASLEEQRSPADHDDGCGRALAFEQRPHGRERGLTVWLPGRLDLVCFKLYTAADHWPTRDRHLSDLVHLAPVADDLAFAIEALIVATAAIGAREPRLAEVAESWRAAHPEAVNSFRLRSVAAEMGEDLAGPADDRGRPTVQAARDLLRPVDLRRPGLLLWRLRAAFGLNVRADIVAHLSVRPPGWISIAELAGTVRFTKRNVAGAVASLRQAGLVESDRFIGADRVRLADDRDLRTWLGVAPGDVRVVDQVTLYGAALAALRLEGETRATADVVALLEARALAERIGPE